MQFLVYIIFLFRSFHAGYEKVSAANRQCEVKTTKFMYAINNTKQQKKLYKLNVLCENKLYLRNIKPNRYCSFRYKYNKRSCDLFSFQLLTIHLKEVIANQ